MKKFEAYDDVKILTNKFVRKPIKFVYIAIFISRNLIKFHETYSQIY